MRTHRQPRPHCHQMHLANGETKAQELSKETEAQGMRGARVLTAPEPTDSQGKAGARLSPTSRLGESRPPAVRLHKPVVPPRDIPAGADPWGQRWRQGHSLPPEGLGAVGSFSSALQSPPPRQAPGPFARLPTHPPASGFPRGLQPFPPSSPHLSVPDQYPDAPWPGPHPAAAHNHGGSRATGSDGTKGPEAAPLNGP